MSHSEVANPLMGWAQGSQLWIDKGIQGRHPRKRNHDAHDPKGGLIQDKPEKGEAIRRTMTVSMSVRILEIHAERLVEGELNKVQMQTQLNAPSGPLERRSPSLLVMPFVFSVNFMPASGTLTFHGQIAITGEAEHLERISKEIEEKKLYMPALQLAFNHSVATSVLVCRELGLPFPLGIPQLSVNEEALDKRQQAPVVRRRSRKRVGDSLPLPVKQHLGLHEGDRLPVERLEQVSVPLLKPQVILYGPQAIWQIGVYDFSI